VPDAHRRPLRILLGTAVAVLVAGLWALVLRGADGPADPALGEAVHQPAPLVPPPGEPDRVLLEGFDEVAVTVDSGDGPTLAWCLLAALNAQQRARGLMEVTDLQGYSGMAFVYDEDVENAFYMRNTPTPLSIAWVAADGEVVSTRDMEPCEDRDGCPSYPPGGRYRYAIETFRGDLDDLGITEDARVTVGGPCAPRDG
jgi:uncharacterized membrane protein (UPF0127 family)